MSKDPVKLYVLVRRDLPANQPAVQACHAALAIGQDRLEAHGWTNGVLVLLGVRDESHLLFWHERLKYEECVPQCIVI